MLIGVGCDLIEIERVKKACEKEAFLTRIYTERERRQAKGDPRVLAGTFAVKEAVAKVFGTGFRDFMPVHVEVLSSGSGRSKCRSLTRRTMRWRLPSERGMPDESSSERKRNESV